MIDSIKFDGSAVLGSSDDWDMMVLTTPVLEVVGAGSAELELTIVGLGLEVVVRVETGGVTPVFDPIVASKVNPTPTFPLAADIVEKNPLGTLS